MIISFNHISALLTPEGNSGGKRTDARLYSIVTTFILLVEASILICFKRKRVHVPRATQLDPK